jgi:hypothetical protein
MSQSELSFSFKDFDVEMFFAKRLREHRRPVFEGTTDPELRKQRVRAAIIAGGVDCTIIGRAPDGKPETYAQILEQPDAETPMPAFMVRELERRGIAA